MQQNSFKDRRFPRVQAEHSILVRLLGGPSFEGFARTRTIGLGGCMFVLPESLGCGSLMELLIAVDGRVLKTDARVAYELEQAGLRLQVGVEFLRVAPADRTVLDGLIARRNLQSSSRRPARPELEDVRLRHSPR